jgi:hypothetical protein
MLTHSEKRVLQDMLEDTEKSLQKRLEAWESFPVKDGDAAAFYHHEFEPFKTLKEKLEKDYELRK